MKIPKKDRKQMEASLAARIAIDEGLEIALREHKRATQCLHENRMKWWKKVGKYLNINADEKEYIFKLISGEVVEK